MTTSEVKIQNLSSAVTDSLRTLFKGNVFSVIIRRVVPREVSG